MMYFTYRRIKKKVLGLASKIGVPANLLPYYKYSNGEQSPLIEVDKNGNFHYIQIERGKEFERKSTDKLDELLYWIFSDVTFWMAINFELNNGIDNQDNRRITFEQQEKLVGIISESWRQLINNEHLRILKDLPFDDLAGLRATYCSELREKGLEESEIDKLAYEKYPIN